MNVYEKLVELAKIDKPKKVYFGKGTVSIEPPEGAVARLGSSESFKITFLNVYGKAIETYEYDCISPMHPYATKIENPKIDIEKISLSRIYPLGRSSTNRTFGTSR